MNDRTPPGTDTPDGGPTDDERDEQDRTDAEHDTQTDAGQDDDGSLTDEMSQGQEDVPSCGYDAAVLEGAVGPATSDDDDEERSGEATEEPSPSGPGRSDPL